MEREPTADDVRAAWANFRHEWDFSKRPELRIPLNQPMQVIDIVVPSGNEALQPVRVRHAIVRLEYGRLDGRRARRLVGSVPGTDISVVLETMIDAR